MTYRLEFTKKASRAWKKLNPAIQTQFKEKLKERVKNPIIPSAKLSGMKDCYKIKLNSLGYRLVYQVCNGKLIVTVIAVGKRENNKVYIEALDSLD